MRTPRWKRRLAFVFFSNSQNDHGSCMLQREAPAQTQREFTCDHHPSLSTSRERWSKESLVKFNLFTAVAFSLPLNSAESFLSSLSWFALAQFCFVFFKFFYLLIFWFVVSGCSDGTISSLILGYATNIPNILVRNLLWWLLVTFIASNIKWTLSAICCIWANH